MKVRGIVSGGALAPLTLKGTIRQGALETVAPRTIVHMGGDDGSGDTGGGDSGGGDNPPTGREQSIAVIGDSLTVMYAGTGRQGPTLIPQALAAQGWNPDNVRVHGHYGMQIANVSGTAPQESTLDIIDDMRADGFDPKTWCFALGTNDNNSKNDDGVLLREVDTQKVIDKVMSGPETDYTIHWIGLAFYDDSRYGECTQYDSVLVNFEAKYPGRFFGHSYNGFCDALKTDPRWDSWWNYPSDSTDHTHNTMAGYQDMRAPFYAWSIGAPPGKVTKTDWTDIHVPWALQLGESLTDNLPSGVTLIDYDDYSNGGSRDFGATMTALNNAATGPYVVRMPAGTFHITSFKPTWANAGAGWFDNKAAKRWCGILGNGAWGTTIELDPEIMTSSQLNDISQVLRSPVQYMTLFMGSPSKSAFFSGVTFRGNFQQEISLKNTGPGTAPAPYSGLHLDSVPSGSRIQYCRFQGAGFAARANPPYELGAIESLHSYCTTFRCEVDGRVAAEVDANRPVSSGGIMWNFEHQAAANDSWMHHTRRSGWAMHDHFTTENGGAGNINDNGVYSAERMQVEHVADTPDDWAGTALGFNPSNVEALGNSFTYKQCRFHSSTPHGPQHICLSTMAGEDLPRGGVHVIDPFVDDTAYNGCLIFVSYKNLVGQGTTPWYQVYQDSGIGALPLTVTQNGTTLTGVDFNSFNASVHTPDKYFLLRFI